MDIAGNRWRREREEFMHPRYARAREPIVYTGKMLKIR